MVDHKGERLPGQKEAESALRSDFRDRLSSILEDLDAADEQQAAVFVEQAIAKLTD